MPIKPFKTINVGNRALNAYKFGNPIGVPVLIAGPASIYIESLRLDKFCCLYGVDHYWTKEANVPKQDITSLSPDRLAHDLESYRQALQKIGEPVEKVVVLGPSAVGLTAAKYAAFYPDRTLGVIMLNTPLGLHGLLEAQEKFINENYNPEDNLGKHIATNTSVHLWKAYRNKRRKYKENEEKGFVNDDTQYMEELLRDEIKYYQDPEAAKEMYRKWPSFNIDMRNQFFKMMQEENPSFLKGLECPVFNSLGMADGIVPFPFVLEDQSAKEPRKYTPYIFKSAHMPPLEDSSFPKTIERWLKDNNIAPPLDSTSQLRSKL
jgi:pimeloyl-ACP methyl ester carboxylesterase